jgi:small subunit ribosomal protein S1
MDSTTTTTPGEKTGAEEPAPEMSPEENPSATPSAEEDFGALLDQSMEQQKVEVGEVVAGEVIAIGSETVTVDIGYKSEGEVPLVEFRQPDGTHSVNVGDTIKVFFEAVEDEEGIVWLSKEKADQLRIWDDLQDAYNKEEVVEGRIVQRVKGGLSADIGVPAFLPGSQVDLRPVKNLDELIGKTFSFKILKFNKKRGNIVLSRRVLLEKERDALRKETLKQMEEGVILEGIVKNITDYGAFIDLGGVDGLLHITDMSWGRVGHPSEILSIGDEINVKVLRYDRERERVSLGLKQTKADPWSAAAESYPVGTKLEGRVVSLTDYGAFVELEEGIEGLIHISEMSWVKKIRHPSQILSVQDVIEAVVLNLDVENQRISLGLKQTEPNPWAVLKEKYPKGSRITGVIRNITDFGIFVGIEDGIDGLVHISDLSWTHKIKHPSEMYKKGDELDAVVLNIDEESNKFSLGIKQLEKDPWDEIPDRYRLGDLVKGGVTNVTDFGIFLELEKGIEGLIHISELSDDRVEDIRNFTAVGDDLEAKIIHLDPRERKIGLSIKALKKDQEKADMDAFLSQKEEPHRVEEDWKQELRDLSKTLDLPDADRPDYDGSGENEASVSGGTETDPTGAGAPDAETPEEASDAEEEGEEEKPEG